MLFENCVDVPVSAVGVVLPCNVFPVTAFLVLAAGPIVIPVVQLLTVFDVIAFLLPVATIIPVAVPPVVLTRYKLLLFMVL